MGASPDAGSAYSKKRSGELWDALAEVVRTCRREETELLLVAGDLFHRQPLLRELKEVGGMFASLEKTKVVLIAGNHDYIRQDSYYRTFHWSSNVTMLKEEKLECAEFPELNLAVYGLSYHSREIREARYEQERPRRRQKYEILLAHGGDSRHLPIERSRLAQSPFSYIALGHIHKPQTLHVRPGRNVPGPVVRYCGSPLPLSFDEVYRHSVSIVEISEKKEVKIREEEIPCIMPALTVPENPVPFETALKALKDFPAEKNAYIRLNVQITDYLPQNASIQAAQMAEGKKCKYCGMKITRSGENRGRETESLTVDEIKAINPIDVAKMFYRKKFGIEMNAEMEDMLNCVIEEISEEKDERK